MTDVAKEKKGFQMLLIILLVFNTFFIGNIWWVVQNCAMAGGCPTTMKMCLLTEKFSAGKKICPLTGKPLPAGVYDAKGSTK
jgi:hypothetical protein